MPPSPSLFFVSSTEKPGIVPPVIARRKEDLPGPSLETTHGFGRLPSQSSRKRAKSSALDLQLRLGVLQRHRVAAGREGGGADAVVVEDAEAGAGGRIRRAGGPGDERQGGDGEQSDQGEDRNAASAWFGSGKHLHKAGKLSASPVPTMHGSDARTDYARRALYARAGRLARDRGPGGHLFPPRLRLGSRRPARGRHLLHPLRLPDHRHPARPVQPPRDDPPRPLLARPRPPPPAGALPDAADRARLGDDLRPRPAGPVPQVGRLGDLLREQLAADRRQRVVLRPLRAGTAAEPSLVAVGRGAVLHLLALPPVDRAETLPRQTGQRAAAAPGDRHPRPGDRLLDPDGGPLPPEPRPLAGLLRDRHPRRRAPLRRRPGDGLAESPPGQADHPAGAQNARRDRRARPADHRDHDLADRRVLPVPLPRRLRRPLAGDGDGADAARPPGLQARQRRSVPNRCAGSASAPTASTSGRRR